jgi:hypothetical protein
LRKKHPSEAKTKMGLFPRPVAAKPVAAQPLPPTPPAPVPAKKRPLADSNTERMQEEVAKRNKYDTLAKENDETPGMSKKSSTVRRYVRAKGAASHISPVARAANMYNQVDVDACHSYQKYKDAVAIVKQPPVAPKTAEELAEDAASIDSVSRAILGTNDGIGGMLVNPWSLNAIFGMTVDQYDAEWARVQVRTDKTRPQENEIPITSHRRLTEYMREADSDPTTQCVFSVCMFSVLCKLLQHPANPRGEKVGLSFPLFPHSADDAVVKIRPPMPQRSSCVICMLYYVGLKVEQCKAQKTIPSTFPNPCRVEVEKPGGFYRDNIIFNPKDQPLTCGPFPKYSEWDFAPEVDDQGRARLKWAVPVFQ